MTATIKIFQATNNDDLKLCLKLRRETFIEEQGVDEALEVDGEDEICRHFLMYANGCAVAAGRAKPVEEKVKLQRICVKKAARGHGYGEKLVQFMLADLSKDVIFKTAYLGSQCHAIAFYEKLGFEAYGPIYFDAEIEHRDMQITLPIR